MPSSSRRWGSWHKVDLYGAINISIPDPFTFMESVAEKLDVGADIFVASLWAAPLAYQSVGQVSKVAPQISTRVTGREINGVTALY